jgi:hypothetical protein
MLQWAVSAPNLNRDKFGDWLMAEYNVSKGTVTGYRQVVTGVGVLESYRDGRLEVTSFGKRVLEAEGQAKAKLVVERLMRTFLAFPEVLAFYAQNQDAVHIEEMVAALQPHFPRWTSNAQYEYRALWLLSLGCLKQERGRHYKITDFGKAIAAQFPVEIESQAPPEPAPETQQLLTPVAQAPAADKVSLLIAALEDAAIDSQNPEHLERATAEAFEYLGFAVDQLGEVGETDVLVQANMGPESYTVIVDAKARRDGKLQNLEVYTLQDHLQSNEADYAVVVAGRFAGGKVTRHAQESGIVLLSVSVLGEWLRLHAHTPLNLSEYRCIFTTPGLLEDLPPVLKSSAERRALWANLLVDLVELIRETYEHGLNQSLPSNQLFAMLVTRLRGVRYPRAQVQEAIALLTHPAFKIALGDGDTGIALAMNRSTLVQALRALADQIETIDAETEV